MITTTTNSQDIRSVRLDPSCGDTELFFRAWLKGTASEFEQRSCDHLKLSTDDKRLRFVFPERRTLNSDNPTAGGYTTQESFLAGWSLGMRHGWSWADLVTRATLPPVMATKAMWPWADDNEEAQIQTYDEQSVTTATDASFGLVNLYPKIFNSRVVKVSRRWLTMFGGSAEYIGRVVANRIAKKMAREFTAGVGTAGPIGFAKAVASGETAVGAAQTTAASGVGGITRDDVENLYWSVATAYRNAPNAAYQCHSTIAKYLSKLCDGQGAPHKLVTTENGQLRLNGRRLVVNDFMSSSMASGEKSLAYGGWGQFVVLESALDLQRLDELYSVDNQVGFIGRVVADGQLLDPNSIGTIKCLVH